MYIWSCGRFSGPALFISRLLMTCCLLWAVQDDPLGLYREHLRYNALDQEQRNNDLMAYLLGAWHRESDGFDRFRVDGLDMCESCFTTLLGITSSTWANRKQDFRAGARHWEHGGLGHTFRFSTAGQNTRLWMQEYFETLGDHQPDTGQVHLPPGDKKDIYDELQHDLGGECVKLSQFYQIWEDEFAHVKLPAQQRLGKCKTCDTLRKQIMATRDKAARAKLKAERREHMKSVKANRSVYHSWRRRAREEPDKYMVVTLDGMDQSKTNIPDHNTSESNPSLTVRVIGALVHTFQKLSYAFLVTDFTKETNTNIEVLRRVLDDQAKLPPTLVLQLDNTSQENKNSHLFTFLAELVEAGIFENIIVNFLPVGHTHVRVIPLPCVLFHDQSCIFLYTHISFVHRRTSIKCFRALPVASRKSVLARCPN